jgi:hypothetical protein
LTVFTVIAEIVAVTVVPLSEMARLELHSSRYPDFQLSGPPGFGAIREIGGDTMFGQPMLWRPKPRGPSRAYILISTWVGFLVGAAIGLWVVWRIVYHLYVHYPYLFSPYVSP